MSCERVSDLSGPKLNVRRDEQKWASCSWLLLRHLAREAPPVYPIDRVEDEGTRLDSIEDDSDVPTVSYADARQIMTRTDFIEP